MDEATIQRKIDELRQKTQLNRRERRYLAKLEAKLTPKRKPVVWKGILTKIAIIFASILLMAGLIWYVASRPNLPPTDLARHIEQNPPSHILNDPMPEVIQKHMLEHADGKGAPGIVIQYNCQKYSCEKGLVKKLEAIIKKYPQHVYLAPGNYDGMIILTRLGQREVLDKFDEKKILNFINQ